MRYLDFDVTDQHLSKNTKCNFENIVKNSKGYLVARFNFNQEWNNTRKAAVFKNLGKEYYAAIVDNQCEIPWEALTYNRWKVSVVGETADGSKRIITNELGVEQCQ